MAQGITGAAVVAGTAPEVRQAAAFVVAARLYLLLAVAEAAAWGEAETPGLFPQVLGTAELAA